MFKISHAPYNDRIERSKVGVFPDRIRLRQLGRHGNAAETDVTGISCANQLLGRVTVTDFFAFVFDRVSLMLVIGWRERARYGRTVVHVRTYKI